MLDLDVYKAPAKLRPIEALLLELRTPMQRSGGGGLHVLFAGRAPRARDVKVKLGLDASVKGVDIKAHAAGYIAVEPSVHPDGKQYKWLVPPDVPAIEAPEWCRVDSTAPRPRARDGCAAAIEPISIDFDAMPPSLRERIDAAGAAEKGKRSEAIFSVVSALRESGLYSRGHALWLIRDSGMPFCSKALGQGRGWAERDVLEIWSKGDEKQRREIEADFPDAPATNIGTYKTIGPFYAQKASERMHILKSTPPPVLGAALPGAPVVMLAGLGGTGKSTIAATWAAHVTSGQPCLPWEKIGGAPRAPAGVLWLTSEEDVDGMVIPRHDALGGDLNLLVVPERIETVENADGVPRPVTFDIERHLRGLLVDCKLRGVDIRLVVCDALPALVNWNGRNPNGDADVKQMLDTLRQIAEEFACCILGLSHLNKKDEVDDAYRMTGAQAWRESPRLSYLCKGGVIYTNKSNDMPGVGCTYTQSVERVLGEVEAETSDGKPLQRAARRAEFGRSLLPKSEALLLVNTPPLPTPRTLRAEQPRIDKLANEVRQVLQMLGPLEAGYVWGTLGKEVRGDEKKKIKDLLSLRYSREGQKHMLALPD